MLTNISLFSGVGGLDLSAKCLINGRQDRWEYYPAWLGMSIIQIFELGEIMMGWRKGWTALDAVAMEWFRNKRCRLGKK